MFVCCVLGVCVWSVCFIYNHASNITSVAWLQKTREYDTQEVQLDYLESFIPQYMIVQNPMP